MTYAVFKEKIIIVADHENFSGQQNVANVLRGIGFKDVRQVNDGVQIFEILRPLYDIPDSIALIVINEKLPSCPIEDLIKVLCCGRNGSLVPFLILRQEAKAELPDALEAKALTTDAPIFHTLIRPFKTQELMSSIGLLMRLKDERLLRLKQSDKLVNELAQKNVLEAKLKFLVAHDELTGLFNRSNFEYQLRELLSKRKTNDQIGTLLFIDIDRFSQINELEGFDVGDSLLVELTLLTRKLIPKQSVFARIGADEFCLYLNDQDIESAHSLARIIKSSIDEFRFYSGEVAYSVTISIGIATLNDITPIQHPGQLILYARQACNLAKICGRDKIRVYSSQDDAINERRRDIYWVPIIRKSLRDNELFLVFQPVVNLLDGEVSHYEVLVRMRGEDGQTISPDKFIPTAERMGLIYAIDYWVIEQAIEFLHQLTDDLSKISLAINLSGAAFQYPDLLKVIEKKLTATGLDPSRLTFEITETSAVENFEKTRDMINRISLLGCKFALDDFGAGYCSFNYLKTFPVDYVKIDGQFIRNLISDETDQILVKSMVDIAAKLGKQTIAEFVESPTTVKKLQEIGVSLGQGYVFGKPEPQLLDSPSIALARL